MNSYLIQYLIDSHRGFIDSILSVTLNNDQLQCLMTKKFTVLRKRLKIYTYKNNNFHKKNSHNNFSKIKHVLDHYTVNNFLKY